ncbi:MAG: cupin domain-containing protein [Armatimonadota bacterium]|nr:cupin domain-containing protein [Armatimonadota bacterium]MDR7519247.1 cupin domain-containing protein [Armatimonadota bacterium]
MLVRRIDPAQAHPAVRPEYFEGQVRMQALYEPDRDGEESEMVAVFFEAGARTTPHTHDSTQVLQVVSGRVVVVIEDDRYIADVGDFVIIPRGLWHWHGATRDGPACHISIKLPGRTHWDVPRRNWTDG